MRRNPIILLGIAATLAALAVPSLASDLAVGANGQVIRLLSGAYGDLFPQGDEAPAGASVLALELTDGADVRRTLVPLTENVADELMPTLYHDPTHDSSYVLWSSRHNGVHPYLRLARLNGTEWDDVLDITGSVFADKHDPKLSVHHDSWTTDDGTLVERTIFHVLWWEQFGSRAEKRMAGLVLENGTLVGSTGLVTLGDLAPEDKKYGNSSPLDAELPVVQTRHGFLTGFVGQSGRIEVFNVEVLPEALSSLAAAAENAILSQGWSDTAGLEAAVIDAMIAAGDGLHSATLGGLAEAVLQIVAETPPGLLQGQALHDLADKAMGQIIHIGARMKIGAAPNGTVSTLQVRPAAPALAPMHHWLIDAVAGFDMPEVEGADAARLFISKRGSTALVAWDEDSRVAYRETTSDGGWGEINYLKVGNGLDRDTAYRILEERTLER